MIGGRRTKRIRGAWRRAPRAGVALVLALAVAVPAAVRAQVTVAIRPARTSVAVGDILRVNVEIVSTVGMPDSVSDMPSTGFVQLGSAQSESMEFSFGMGGGNQQRLRLVRTFTLQAQSPGEHTIGPVQVQLGSQTFASGSVSIQVRPGTGNAVVPGVPGTPTTPTPLPLYPGSPPSVDDPDAESLPRSVCRRPDGSPLPETGMDGPATCTAIRPDLFLQLEVTDTRVYLGEPLRLQIRAFVEREIVGFSIGQLFSQIIRKEPAMEGFLRTNLEPREISVESQFIQGRQYLWTTLRDKLLYPTRVGRLQLGPAEGLVALHDLFRSQEVRRATAAVPIEVLPLPGDGKPDGFSPNNVGARLSSNLSAVPASVRAGEPVELTLSLWGEGNLAGFRIDPPAVPGATVLKSSDKVIEPTAEELNGRRTVTFLVTPSTSGELDFSSYGVPYFDFLDEHYRVARAAPVRVAVAPAAPGTTVLPPLATPGQPGVSTPGQPTAAMRPWNDLGRPVAPWHGHRLFWVLLLVPPASLAGLYIVAGTARAVRRRRGLVRPGDVFRRSAATIRRVSKGRGTGDAAAQLAAVEGALLDYLEARVGEPLRGYATAELQRRLATAGFDEARVTRLVIALETCAFGRFAPGASRQQGANDAARGALEVLHELEGTRLSRTEAART